jgi:steroid delta-isomerase-like uncharacterized protein
MSAETNKAISRRFFDEAWNEGNLTALDEILTQDHFNSGPSNLPGLPAGPEGGKQVITLYRNAFPDVHFTIDEQLTEGERVVTRWTAHGTHQGELQRLPATGKSSTVSGIAIDRFVDGKIAETWGLFDYFSMMQQLGVIPMPEATDQ